MERLTAKEEIIFFDITLFHPRRKVGWGYVPIFMALLLFLTKEGMYGMVLLHLILIIVISSILGVRNINFLISFFEKNKGKFTEEIKTVVNYVEQHKGREALKASLSIRGHLDTWRLSKMISKVWHKSRWKQRKILLFYSLPIFLPPFFSLKPPFFTVIKPEYFILYPLLLFGIANGVCTFVGYIYWRKKLKVVMGDKELNKGSTNV